MREQVTNEEMPKVLIVEDSRIESDMIRRKLENSVLVVQAFDKDQAVSILKHNPELAIILMDACVPGSRPNTIDLVRRIRETFQGPMVAISSNPDYRSQLMQAGCDYESDKLKGAEKVFEILGIPNS